MPRCSAAHHTSPSPSDYRSRLNATQQRRKTRSSTSGGDSTVSDFNVATSSTKPQPVNFVIPKEVMTPSRRKKVPSTPQPFYQEDSRRSQSAPRSSQHEMLLRNEGGESLIDPTANQTSAHPSSKVSWKNGDTVHSFQPQHKSRLASTAGYKPKSNHPSSNARKMSLSKLQHDQLQELQKQQPQNDKNTSILRPSTRTQRTPSPILREPAFLDDESSMHPDPPMMSYCMSFSNSGKNSAYHTPPKTEQQPLSRNATTGTSSTAAKPSISPRHGSSTPHRPRESDPRHYVAATELASLSKADRSEIPLRAKSADPTSRHRRMSGSSNRNRPDLYDGEKEPKQRKELLERPFHQKMTDCLMLAADLYHLEEQGVIDDGSSLDISKESSYPTRSTPQRDHLSSTRRGSSRHLATSHGSAIYTSNGDTVETDENTETADDIDGTATTHSSGVVDDFVLVEEQRQTIPERSGRYLEPRVLTSSSDDRLTTQSTKNQRRSGGNYVTAQFDEDRTFYLDGLVQQEQRNKRSSSNSQFENCSTIASGEDNAATKHDLPLVHKLPRVFNWTRSAKSDVATSPTSVLQMNPDDYERCDRHSSMPTLAPRQLLDSGSDSRSSDRRSDTPPTTSTSGAFRDYQRRPRGKYDETTTVTNKMTGDVTNVGVGTGADDDDDATKASRPYDEYASGRPRLPNQAPDSFHQPQQHDPGKLEVLSTKYCLAMHDIATQEKVILQLRHELKHTQSSLQAAKRDLQQSKTEASKRSQLFEEATSKMFRERITVDESFRLELLTNQRFQSDVAGLRREVAKLSKELENERERSKLNQAVDLDALNVTASKDDVAKSSQENADAERRSDLQRQTEEELLALQSNREDLLAQLDREKAATASQLKELARLKVEHNETQTQMLHLSQELNTALNNNRSDKQVELTRFNDERLDTNRRAEYACKECKRLKEEIAGFVVEAIEYESKILHIENHLAEANNVALSRSSEVMQMQLELNDMKQALTDSNSEIIRQATEHLRERRYMEEELYHLKQPAQCLRNATNSTDDCSATADSVPNSMENRQQGTTENASSTILMDILRRKLDSK